MSAARTMVVWWPDWPVAAAEIEPHVPAVVVSANRVVACSAAARAEGVRRGLRRREAEARCPHLMVLGHDPGLDARAFEPVVAAVEEMAPGVEVLRPGVCAVATRGPSRYFGGDEALVDKVTSVVEAAMPGRPGGCRAGIADGLFAAGLAARRGLVVAIGETPAFLAPLPVATLERPELCSLLVRLGLRTLGAFAALPAPDVVARFGPDGALAHRLAQGLDERPLHARIPPPDFAVQVEFDPPVTRVDTAAFAAKTLADDLHQRLARTGLACTRIAVEAETEHGERLTRLWRTDGAGRGWDPRLGEEAGVGAPAGGNSTDGAGRGWDPRLGEEAGVGAPAGKNSTDGAGRGWGPRLGEEAGDGAPAGKNSMHGLTPTAIAERVRWQLDGWLGGTAGTGAPSPTAGLSMLRLAPDEVVPDGGRQIGFWGEVDEAAARAARALTRVQGMLGPEAVVTAVRSGGREPAEQVTFVPWGDVREPSHPPDPPWPGRLPPPAPATVFADPSPAEVVDAGGQPVGVTGRFMATAAPARLSVGASGSRTGWADVVAWAGPWPVDERWWDTPNHRRRARFQVLTADGAAWLLALEAGRWWAEATYD